MEIWTNRAVVQLCKQTSLDKQVAKQSCLDKQLYYLKFVACRVQGDLDKQSSCSAKQSCLDKQMAKQSCLDKQMAKQSCLDKQLYYLKFVACRVQGELDKDRS